MESNTNLTLNFFSELETTDTFIFNSFIYVLYAFLHLDLFESFHNCK